MHIVEFSTTMLPKSITREKILKLFDFLSPIYILIHGSHVSNVRFSAKEESDIDIVVVSKKIVFWSLKEIYTEIENRTKKLPLTFDVVILSEASFLAHLNSQSALNQSLMQGVAFLFSVTDENNHSG